MQKGSLNALARPTAHASALGTFDLAYLGQTNQLTSQLLKGGVVGTSCTYGTSLNDRRLKAITNSGAMRSYEFTTTTGNDINEITETATKGSAWAPQTWNYGYDSADRLLHGQSLTGALYAYGYDAANNITEFRSPSANEGASYNDLNQITSFSNETLAYDANGNLLNDGTRTYQWDAENRLIASATTGKAPPSATTASTGASPLITTGPKLGISGAAARSARAALPMTWFRAAISPKAKRFRPAREHVAITGTCHWKGTESTWGRFRPLRFSVLDQLAAHTA